MAFTPGFENDIFISYCHDDNAAPKGKRGRVDHFHDDLESCLVTRFGSKKISIWRDKELQGNDVFNIKIQEKIRQSALFVALMSPNYLKSVYCLDELKWFHQEAEKSGCGLSINNQCRIFNVLLHNIHHDKWPVQLKGASCFPMHDEKEGSENLGEFLHPGDAHYREMLRPIVDAVEMILKTWPGECAKHMPRKNGNIQKISNHETICPACFYDKGHSTICSFCGFDEGRRKTKFFLPYRTLLKGQYLIGKELGVGGFGITYLAFDTALDIPVAVKEFFPRGLALREENGNLLDFYSVDDKVCFEYGLNQFVKEAHLIARFSHPNIVKGRTYFEENNTAYIVMDYYKGYTLNIVIKDRGGRLSEKESMEIMLPILNGLKEIHKKKFLHSDIKPHNIIITSNGAPVLIDFGASRSIIGQKIRNLSTVLTPGFAPFEQYQSRGKQGPWTDIYSCSATLYFMLSGTPPPNAPERIYSDILVPLEKISQNVSPILCNAIMKGLEMRIEDRPQTVDEFLKLLTSENKNKHPQKKKVFSLKFISGKSIGKSIVLTEEPIIIGRDANASLVISNKCVSRFHVKVWSDSEMERIFIYDLGSINGTFIFDREESKENRWKRITKKHLLKPGDRFMIGSEEAEINVELVEAVFYNNKVRLLIKKKQFWDAISIISKAENQNCADDNTRALKEKVIKSISDDVEQSFKKQTKEGSNIDYPQAGSIQGRDGDIEDAIEILDRIPIVTVYGIPGIGKSTFIHELRKHKSHNNRLYKRIIAKPDMTINELFQHLALPLGCRDLLNKTDFDISKQIDFSFLEWEAQYHLDSFIHLDNAQFLFKQDGFHQPIIKEFLIAITQFYRGIRIVLESRIIPPVGIFPEKIHKSVRIQGIDKENMRLYFQKPFKDDNLGWDLTGNEQGWILKNLGGIKEKEKIHPLVMTLLANMAKQTHNSPAEILKNTGTLQRFSDESRELLLDDLNLIASQAENWNIPQNLEMYHEDIPVYLSEMLLKTIGELFPDLKIEALQVPDTVVIELEDKLRAAISKKLYSEGRELIQQINGHDPARWECLKDEFGYIYDFANPETDETNRKGKKGWGLEWRRKVWQVLSMRNNFEITDSDPGEVEKEKTSIPEAQVDINDGIKDQKISADKDKKNSEEIGEDLEKAVLKLFKDFFAIWEEDHTIILENARQQGRGLQFGHDLKFVCGRLGNKDIRMLIECKNYSDKITTGDITGKLAAVEEYFDNIPIDHWILISPNADLANELENFIESWEKKGKYPFKVQTWTPASRVKEFFGLDPDIYDRIIKAHDLNIHPKEWDAEKRKKVIEFWKKKLEPPLRLPRGWQDYLLEPAKLILEDKEREFKKRFEDKNYIELKYIDETRSAFFQPLEDKILQWLEKPVSESPTIFLLGEFGDGKTFFTYILTRKLVEKFRASPKEEWLPVRFALKNFETEGFNRTQDFIYHRLKDFGAEIAGWNELKNNGYKLLVILDGFDEISKALDPETIQKNIDILIKCYTSDYFSGMKLMITSRKHFFENQKDKDKLLDKLDYPQLLHLLPIDRKTTEDYLRMYAAKIGKEENFNKIKECHDPIGLASKPLFLEMVQVSLHEPPGKDFNEYTLYEDYINKALKRKEEYMFDEKKETPKSKIIENLKNVLELIAQRLQQSNREYVFLSDIRAKEDLKQWLWDLSDPCIEDETGHIAARSLLKRVNVGEKIEDKHYPVDFCHRSMREYFVARAICNMLAKEPEKAGEFLTGCHLSYEIIYFAGEIMKNKSKDCDYEKNLLKLIEKTRNVEKIKRLDLNRLGGNAVTLLFQYKGMLPGKDWQNLVLDGALLPNADLSGKDFSNTSLQYANLDNVNFTHSNFSNCNLTDVRIEEATPVQSIAIYPDESILALYQDGILREWQYNQRLVPNSTNLETDPSLSEKIMRIISQPGNDLTILNDSHLFFYDRNGKQLKRKAIIEINPKIRLIKASRDFLLLNDTDGKQNRLVLIDLNELAVVKAFTCSPFTLCDHLDRQALIIYNEKENLKVLDITPGKRADLFIPVKEKISCLATCKCSRLPGGYLLGIGLFNGSVQIWKIQVEQWTSEKLSEQLLHEQGKPIKDLSFIDDDRIVSGSLDKTIKLLTFNPDGQAIGEVKEFKMTLQCRGMKIDGVTREKIEGKKLRELIDKAATFELMKE